MSNYYRIAICDDSAEDRGYIRSILERWSETNAFPMQIQEFSSAENFLFEYAEDKSWDILLLDIEMGDMDGVTLAKRLRQDNETLQIVFITGYSDYIAEGYDVAALHYLMKPVKENKLSEVLDRAVEKLCKNEKVFTLENSGEMVRIPVYQMNLFSMVFQDFKLFPLPLGQNVADSIDYDAERAAQCLHDAGWNEKYDLDTVLYKELDKNGVDLSGGEAQKVAIARALYKDAPFIILDEPTAALDPIVEAEIYEKFDRIVTDKTAVYISHRLSSCKFCDEIVVFDRGSIVQFGTHESLLADSKGKYHELWNAQAQYYTE